MVSLTSEIIAVIFLFAQGLSSSVITNLVSESYCLRIPNITASSCSGLIPKDIENAVQTDVSKFLFYRTAIETLIPGISVIFVGSWSDVNGRRPILLFSVFGYSVSYIIWTVLSLNINTLNPFWYLLACIPICLTGGNAVFYLSLICFISDSTPIKNRAFKMSSFEVACFIGSLVSQLLTARIFETPFGYLKTFSISAISFIFLLMYIYFFFPETIFNPQDVPIAQKASFADTVKTFFKKRTNYRHILLYLLLLANTFYIIIVFGESSIFYLSVQKRFSWQLDQYARYSSISLVVTGFILFSGTALLTKVLKLDDLTSFTLVSFGRIMTSLIFAFTTTSKLLYVGLLFGSISSIITPLYRSKISKIVPLDELGKVMSFIVFTEALIPTCSSFLYAMVYNSLIDVFPGGVFLFSFGFAVSTSFSLIIAFIIQRIYPFEEFTTLEVSSVDIINKQTNISEESGLQ